MALLHITSSNDPNCLVTLSPLSDPSMTSLRRDGSTDDAGVKVHLFSITCDGVGEDVSGDRFCIITILSTAGPRSGSLLS